MTETAIRSIPTESTEEEEEEQFQSQKRKREESEEEITITNAEKKENEVIFKKPKEDINNEERNGNHIKDEYKYSSDIPDNQYYNDDEPQLGNSTIDLYQNDHYYHNNNNPNMSNSLSYSEIPGNFQTYPGSNDNNSIANPVFSSRDYELKPGEISEVIDVDQEVVGRVIGRGGETIRDLQARCGCHIQVNQDFPPGVPRKVVISGLPHKVQIAKEMVESVKMHGPQGLGTMGVEIGPKFQIIECPHHLVGKVIGKHGETINGIKAQSGARVQVDQNYPDGVPRKITISGNPQQVQLAVQLLQQVMNSGTSVMPGQVPGGGGMGTGTSTTQTVDIPRSLVGRVIGRNGETLRQLKQKTGANIYVDQNVPEGSPCKAIISGSSDAVTNAMYWVQDVMVNGPANLSLLSVEMTNPAYLAAASFYTPFFGTPAGFALTGQAHQQTSQMPSSYQYQHPSQHQPQQPKQASPWIEYKTPDGTPYYYNTVTQITQWQKPAGM